MIQSLNDPCRAQDQDAVAHLQIADPALLQDNFGGGQPRTPASRHRRPTPLTLAQILAWADAHQARTGRWPVPRSGPVAGVPGESWSGISVALRQGLRGLPGGDTLARLLRRERHLPERRGRPLHHARHQIIAALHARGLSLAEVGRLLGVSRQAAWQMLQRTAPAGPPSPSSEAEVPR
jgi:hypothetical protein